MAWLNDGQLSRHNIRRGHSVRSVYLTGKQAARVAKQVETRKQERAKISSRLAHLRAEASGLDTRTRQLDQISKALIAATLLGDGFHEHRSCWRRPRRAKLG